MLLVKNRDAYFHYTIEDKIEAGLVLVGTEVKVIRSGGVSLKDGYVKIDDNNEAWLCEVHIASYSHGNRTNHDFVRKRKLLLNKSEILRLKQKMKLQKLTLLPLAMHLSKKGKIKVELGLGRGKKLFDKRQALKEKDSKKNLKQHV